MADNIVRLKVDSTEYDSKIKRAAAGIQHMADACHRAGGVLNVLEKENKEYIQGLGHMETVSRSARGRLAELTSAFSDIKSVYHNLAAEEKASPFGRELAKQLDIMKVRIGDTRVELASINKELGGSKFGQLGGIIDNIGQRFGVTGNLTEMLTSKTALLTGAIGALSAAVVKGGEAWLQYNQQMARQDEITTVTTGLKGADADRMTDQAKALAQTYGTDFREVINAANTLMTQFGKTGDKAMKLLRDGMRGMIHGDGPKLLSMIQQFAPSFQSAGVSAAQLVAVIQNSEGGIFTDQNMQSIVMGIKNIRLMTNATAEALAKVGIDGREMTKQLNDGSLTVFEALKKVAGALSTVDGNSQAAGEVMQTVFGRQGMMAGTNLGKAIAELNTNLEQTKTQTGEVGKSFDDLYEANVKLNKAIRDAFQYDGWDQMANGIKGKLITALADVVSALADVRDVAKDTYKWFDYTLGVGNWLEVGSKVADQMAQNMSAAYNVARMLYGFLDKKAAERAAADAANKALEDVGNAGVLPSSVYPKAAPAKPADTTTTTTTTTAAKTKKEYRAPVISSKYVQGMGINQTESMASLRQQLSAAQQGYAGATNMIDAGAYLQQIQSLQEQIKAQPLALSLGISTEAAANLSEQINTLTDGIELKPIEVNFDVKGAKDLNKIGAETGGTWKDAAGAVGQLGSALQSLEDPGAKVAGIVASAIANIALTFASSLKGTVTPWDWIAASIAGTATMISTIAAIHSATGYAEGGLIKGNTYSGDNIMANGGTIGLNAGELVLNKAQQANIANQLESPALSGDGGSRQSYVRGQDIFLGLNNYLRSTGRGQLVTSR